MGMFDTFYTNCGECGNKIVFQSKADECRLSEYDYSNLPIKIAIDLNFEKGICSKCGSTVEFVYHGSLTVNPRDITIKTY
jgi:DNA-directed RNA polymerase subunit RPC12/RpoP